MRTHKLFSVSILLALTISLSAQSESQMILVSQVNSQNLSNIILQLDGETEATYWDKDYMAVEMTINANVKNKATMKCLVQNRRYNLAKEVIIETLVLSMPELRKKVTVNGIPVEETFSFKIMLPRYFQATQDEMNDKILAYNTLLN